jgi:predicted aspartyl protease
MMTWPGIPHLRTPQLRKIGWLALLALPLFGCATEEKCRMGRASDLPLRMMRHHLVSAVEINGKPADMILDTGSFGTVLTREAVARMQLPTPDWTTAEARGIGGSRSLSVLQTAQFKLGRLHGRNLHFAVFDDPRVLGLTQVDGLLGMDIMSQFDIDIDLPEHKVIFYGTEGGCSRPTVALEQPLFAIPMAQSAHERSVVVEVSIAGKSLRALLDSGADSNVLFRSAARRLGLNDAALTGDHQASMGGIGPRAVQVRQHIIEPVSIGDLTIRNMPVDISPEIRSGDFDMILGLGFFLRVHVWMSFSSHTVIMEFPPKASPAVKG